MIEGCVPDDRGQNTIGDTWNLLAGTQQSAWWHPPMESRLVCRRVSSIWQTCWTPCVWMCKNLETSIAFHLLLKTVHFDCLWWLCLHISRGPLKPVSFVVQCTKEANSKVPQIHTWWPLRKQCAVNTEWKVIWSFKLTKTNGFSQANYI